MTVTSCTGTPSSTAWPRLPLPQRAAARGRHELLLGRRRSGRRGQRERPQSGDGASTSTSSRSGRGVHPVAARHAQAALGCLSTSSSQNCSSASSYGARAARSGNGRIDASDSLVHKPICPPPPPPSATAISAVTAITASSHNTSHTAGTFSTAAWRVCDRRVCTVTRGRRAGPSIYTEPGHAPRGQHLSRDRLIPARWSSTPALQSSTIVISAASGTTLLPPAGSRPAAYAQSRRASRQGRRRRTLPAVRRCRSTAAPSTSTIASSKVVTTQPHQRWQRQQASPCRRLATTVRVRSSSTAGSCARETPTSLTFAARAQFWSVDGTLHLEGALVCNCSSRREGGGLLVTGGDSSRDSPRCGSRRTGRSPLQVPSR